MPLKCLILKMTLKWPLIPNSLLSILLLHCGTFWFVCSCMVGIPNLNYLEGPLSWASKIRETSPNWKILGACLNICLIAWVNCLLLAKSKGNEQLGSSLWSQEWNSKWFYLSSLIFAWLGPSPSLLLSTLTQAKLILCKLWLCFKLET